MQCTVDSINKGFIENGFRLPTQIAMFEIDDNLRSDIWVLFRHALAASTEILFMFLGVPEDKS